MAYSTDQFVYDVMLRCMLILAESRYTDRVCLLRYYKRTE